MVKDFGIEAQAVNGARKRRSPNTGSASSSPMSRSPTRCLPCANVTGPDGSIIPVIPVNFFYVAARHGDRWLIEDGRAHSRPAPANSMTSRN